MSDSLAQLQQKLGHTFRDPALLRRALTHPSTLADQPDLNEHNQRLEFLGDSVLQLILTEALFQLYPDEREGILSKHRAALAQGRTLTTLARNLGLPENLILGKTEEDGGGRARPKAHEDAFEALVGALYLDTDLATTRRLVLALYGPIPELLAQRQPDENPKGQLQELVQPVHGNGALRYEVLSITGEDHAREYESAVYLLGEYLGAGRGPSKKIAEEAAARIALEKMPRT